MFQFLHLRDGRRLRVTERDCRCWFDELLLPYHLGQYMARPGLARHDLLKAGLQQQEFMDALAD
eukprot:8544670-Karenia_brevis.AAC.1